MIDSETELMLRVKEGDATAFEALYQSYRRPLANYLFRLCWDRSRVDDLLQEVFLRIWRAAPDYEPSAKVSTYFFRIAHNLWINEGMKKRAEARDDLEKITHDNPARSVERGETESAVRRAIETIPQGEKECLILSHYNDLTYEEIGEILGIPEGTVKSRIWTALQRLREKLRDHLQR